MIDKQAERQAIIEFLNIALTHTGGRAFLKKYLSEFPFLGMTDMTETVTSETLAFHEGKRSAGVVLYTALFAANANQLTSLLQEMCHDGQSRD